MTTLNDIRNLLSKIDIVIMGVKFWVQAHVDKKNENGRIYLQAIYYADCQKTNEHKEWHGRKFYLSDHMTKDEIVKTAYLAFKLAVEHEVMESFKVNNIILFNPHINFEELLSISHKEIKRNQ